MKEVYPILQELGPSSSWTRIFYGDKTSNHADRNAEYRGSINVLAEEHGSQLIIKDVRPSDDGMFFCKVNAMAAGNAEGSTHLRVFGKKQIILLIHIFKT